ncbi:MAG: hypothetical protein P1U56_15990 [Saprospiraceae bacterium]|nr:hypothetical protein [Saprospiraceae bacterium]
MQPLQILIFILFMGNQSDAQRSEVELLTEMKKRMSIEELLGKYQEHKGLSKLYLLNERKDFDTESIGFILGYTKPYSPAPFDIIPFARTGGDGCYFAFLTDFGRFVTIEDCPILFVSPSDFDKNKPNQSNILFANNFDEFLAIMHTLTYAEIIRFQDLTVLDFETKIKEVRQERNEYDAEESKALLSSTLHIIEEEFDLSEIANLNTYYTELNSSRDGRQWIKLRDGIHLLKAESENEDPEIMSTKLPIEALKEWLKKTSMISRLAFYRDCPYIYSFSDDDYGDILQIIANQMAEDKMTREASIIEFEIKQNKLSKAYFNLRRSKMTPKN